MPRTTKPAPVWREIHGACRTIIAAAERRPPESVSDADISALWAKISELRERIE